MFSPNACVEKTSDQNLITQSQTLPNNLDNDNTSNTGKKEEIKQYGITSPVNVDPPTKKEIIKTREFLTYFQSLNILEPKEAMSKKLILLDKLNKLTKNWITEFLIKKRMPSSDAQAIGGHIRTFGSYRLGVNTIGGDIDAVLIVPMHIERKDFFESFSTFLRSRSDVKNLRCITEAYVPVMKFLFCDVEFDLLFCRITRYKVEDDIKLSNPTVLRDMDIKDIRSINGFRVADEILSLIPSTKNFKIVLHAVKLWAKINGLYSNIFGFFGGITWAILVARICQLYPRAVPSVVIQKFFMLYANWDWDKHPVVLKSITYGPRGMTLPQWHISATDQNKLMSVITPTYPEQNSCHNVTLSTRTIITRGLKRGEIASHSIVCGNAKWETLFTPYNFFQCYIHFLVLSAHSGSEVKLLEWNGFVESKLRLLIMTLEKNIYIKIAHLHPKIYGSLPQENLPFTRRWFIGLEINKPEDNTPLKIDLFEEIEWFKREVLVKSNSCIYYPDKTITFLHVKRKQLRDYLPVEEIGRSIKKMKVGDKSNGGLAQDHESMQNLLPISSQKRKLPPNETSLPVVKNCSNLDYSTKEYLNGNSALHPSESTTEMPNSDSTGLSSRPAI